MTSWLPTLTSPAAGIGQELDLSHTLAQVVENRDRPLQQGAAIESCFDALRRAIEQRDAERALHFGNRLRYGGLGKRELCGGFCHAAGLRHGPTRTRSFRRRIACSSRGRRGAMSESYILVRQWNYSNIPRSARVDLDPPRNEGGGRCFRRAPNEKRIMFELQSDGIAHSASRQAAGFARACRSDGELSRRHHWRRNQGSTAALSLQRHGFRVSVNEQTSELGEVGAGLVAHAECHACPQFPRCRRRNRRNVEPLGRTSDQALSERGSPAPPAGRRSRAPVEIRRRPFSGSSCGPSQGAEHGRARETIRACIHLDRRLTDLAQDKNGVVARFADGSVARGDVLIGCDGARSIARDKSSWFCRRLPTPVR